MTQTALIDSLTPRQLEVISMIAKGKSNKQTAVLLSINSRTVQKHLEKACKKIGVDTRIELVVIWAKWQALQEIDSA